jgi:hypothetical protein
MSDDGGDNFVIPADFAAILEDIFRRYPRTMAHLAFSELTDQHAAALIGSGEQLVQDGDVKPGFGIVRH